MVRKVRHDVRVFEAIFLYIVSGMKADRIYGYELSAKAREISDGHESPSYGVIYPFLRRMERAQIVKSRKDEASGRIYYELTQKGKLAVQELPQKLKEAQDDFNEMLLGRLRIYSKLYGHKALNDLVKRTEKNE